MKRGKPFLETTLWRIFECLVDGLSVLQEGAEISIDPVTGVTTPTPVPGWNVLVHFDMKPDNGMNPLSLCPHLPNIS